MKKTKTIITIVTQLILFTFIFCIPMLYAHSPEIDNGIQYLYSNQNTEGYWGDANSEVEVFPTTTTVIETLKLLGEEYNKLHGSSFIDSKQRT